MQSDTTSTQLVVALRRSADALVSQHSVRDLEHAFSQIVHSAVDTVPGAVAGGVSVTGSGHVETCVPTDDEVRQVDETQARLGEGPCITAVLETPDDGVVHAADLTAPPDAERWPSFAPRAVEHGFRSMISTQLSTTRRARASLNLYARHPHAFDRTARSLTSLFGTQAAILLHGAEEVSNLNTALETRDVIGRAKGILMERFDVDDQRAFGMLVRSSQDTNLKLVDVARWLTGDDRRVPGPPPDHPPR